MTITLCLLIGLSLLCSAQFPLGLDDPNAGSNQVAGLTCYMGAFYGYSSNVRNFEVRICNPAVKYCGVIIHNKAENDLPGISMRLTCEQAAIHCDKSGIVDAALFVARCCTENLCNFK